jgi:hypothetical protein
VEILFAAALLMPFALGAWVLAIMAYGRAREADRRARALEARLRELERRDSDGRGGA